jgi:hypothetical protein
MEYQRPSWSRTSCSCGTSVSITLCRIPSRSGMLMRGLRSEMERPTSVPIRFRTLSETGVKRRIRRSLSIITMGTFMLLNRLSRSLLTWLSSAFRLCISALSVVSSSFDDCSSSLVVCNSSFALCNSSLLD